MPREKIDIRGVFAEASAGLTRAATSPNIFGYGPHSKQIMFHQSTARHRLYIGGNRSGKTVGGCVEDIYWLRGENPHRRVPPPPVHGRIIGVDFDNGVEKILKPQIARWIPPSSLINGSWEDSYSKSLKTLTLENGSTLEFMSYVQEVEKFAGTSRHFIHYDEEPPYAIWDENNARLVDTGGSSWYTMTPVQGMTWIYHEIYVPGVTGKDANIAVIQVDMTENPYISQVEIDEFLSRLGPAERKARKEGKFIQMGGLIFKDFGIRHVIQPIDLAEIMGWRWIASLDHGFNNPTAWLWHAISPDGKVITFHEHFQSEWTIEQHAAEVHRVNRQFGRAPELFVGDPSIRQRNAATGHSIQIEYVNRGLPIALANNDVKIGIDRMNGYIRHPDGYWLITENCPNLIRELQSYRWKTRNSAKLRYENNPYEEPHKKDDHAVDSSRYFFTFMPDLTLPNEEPKASRGSRIVAEAISPVTPYNHTLGTTDPGTAYSSVQPSTEWSPAGIDEYMGGEW